jgi:hypothetical protein
MKADVRSQDITTMGWSTIRTFQKVKKIGFQVLIIRIDESGKDLPHITNPELARQHYLLAPVLFVIDREITFATTKAPQ